MVMQHQRWFKMDSNFEILILKLDENVLVRFESNVKEGTLFLYNVQTSAFWFGNKSAFKILNMLNGEFSIEHICNEYHKIYPNINYTDIKSSIISLLGELLEKKFLKVINMEVINEFID